MATFHEVGSYRAKVLVAQITESTAKKTPQVMIELELTGEYGTDGKLYELSKKSRYNPSLYLPLTEACLGTPAQPGWVAKVLKYMGFNGDPDNIHEIEDFETDVWCGHEPNEKNEMWEKWSISMPKERRDVAPVDANAKRKIKALLGGLFGKPQQAPAPRPQQEPAPQPARPQQRQQESRRPVQQAAQQSQGDEGQGGDEGPIPF